ncbi:class I SAM-dependent methyltransferase [Rhodonellum sp.]|uniref:class I SAM-dependent methyltransferase n=1 Tax=Rhodonellum sp. TaxID=2231180 RepID=UPI002724D35E|nr:class I SAM-dependent methyltransferase [Rhodonellum sp.]MDO9554180.1 class I SAM-dependent methyltransferase [Rhodonellum sp.]
MENFWNEKFKNQPNLYGDAPNLYFKEKLEETLPGKIMLPGEGEGRNAIYAASKGWKVTAFDQSAIGKTRAVQRAESLGLQIDFQICDANDFPTTPNEFDMLALIYFHLPPPLSVSIYQKLLKALKPGGTLVIEGFGKDQLNYPSGGPKDIEMLYAMNELKGVFPGVKWIEEFDGILTLREGEGHLGDGHIIRLKGIKK